MKKEIKGISHKMLAQQLKELQDDGIIVKQEYSEISPKVEYILSEKGQSLMTILFNMCTRERENKHQ